MVKIITTKYNLAPGVGCWEVQEILGEEKIQTYKSIDIERYKREFIEIENLKML